MNEYNYMDVNCPKCGERNRVGHVCFFRMDEPLTVPTNANEISSKLVGEETHTEDRNVREELKQHITDMLEDDAPIPKEMAIEAYTDTFLTFITQLLKAERKSVLDELLRLTQQIADNAPEGDWYLLPPNAQRVVGYLPVDDLGDVAYKGKPMNIKAVIMGSVEQGVATLTSHKEV